MNDVRAEVTVNLPSESSTAKGDGLVEVADWRDRERKCEWS